MILAAASGNAANFTTDPGEMARLLAGADTWILPQPKAVEMTDGKYDLNKCKGIRLAGCTDPWLASDFPNLLAQRSGVRLAVSIGKARRGFISLALCPGGKIPPSVKGLLPGDIAGLGEQGYFLRVGQSGALAAATSETGLYYAARTLAQIANGRKQIPLLTIRDWPSLRYRGCQYDISRGQMPKLATLARLGDVMAEAKLNMFEPYLEHEFQWQRHPDIAPPEAISPAEARTLFDHAAREHMEVHPFMQTFGHFHNIGTKPAYRKFMVGDGGTVDIRDPAAVGFVMDLLDEVCAAFPGKFLNVDITEINDAAFKSTGTTQQQLNELVLQYVQTMRETVARHGMRLMIAQCQLASEGSLAGLGSVLERLPKDIVIGSYYTAEFYGGWQTDFPRLKKLGIEFFAQPWIDSHGHILPYAGHAQDFSDIEIRRGLQFGATGSTTCDWGDDGHYHLPATTWYPFLYHGASAWTGAQLDRDYFNQAFCRLVFGARDDAIARAILLAGNIDGQKLKIRSASGAIEEPSYSGNSMFGRYYYEFFADPFTDPKVLEIVEPGRVGASIVQTAGEADRLLREAQPSATRNHDALEELLFAVRNYEAMGDKLDVRSHFLDARVPRATVARELLDLAAQYRALKADFERLWQTDCKPNGSFDGFKQRFDQTILPCEKKADSLLRLAR